MIHVRTHKVTVTPAAAQPVAPNPLLTTLRRGVVGVGMLGIGAAALYKAYTKLHNDATRKHIIQDLHLNDPILRDVDNEKLLEWYATIYHFAPKFSLDKNAVCEVLQNFARFGRVDVNTLKMLAETEKALNASDSKSSSWGDVLKGVASTANTVGNLLGA